jgi:hypothetical protein
VSNIVSRLLVEDPTALQRMIVARGRPHVAIMIVHAGPQIPPPPKGQITTRPLIPHLPKTGRDGAALPEQYRDTTQK